MSGSTAQDNAWKAREQGAEAQYARQKEQEQLAALRSSAAGKTQSASKPGELERDFEGGFGGQEDLEDRYATTSGEH
ncbi:uncharacterized protein C8Q71DRAFT_734207 [Rhodofomes roseus]|uniref:ATPase inhibitor, mitochondrial n=1 Tax=Rhodofomes roseus TaxID=34475 RepID=A0ABQ8KWR3_9APHY|nr:uncharacterized protein C8Q71DRAFT_734207 [Rhodofomes roseus]KAH9842740.1 hypothetical protein C8Q71DRAFT_734207 [Rhodofomes roseus]